MDFKLVVAKLIVDDREVLLAFEELQHILKMGYRVLVVFRVLINRTIINAHAPFVIFVDHDDVASEECETSGDDS